MSKTKQWLQTSKNGCSL